jgi:hypothetical protein
MTKRRTPRAQVRGRRPKTSPYKRLEQELANCRNALGTAATNYTDALQALMDLLGYYDRPGRSDWTHADSLLIERIRKIAEGK